MKTPMIGLTLGAALCCGSVASVITVAPSGGQHTSIQTALASANAGDTVLVASGTYHEKISFPKSGSAAQGPIVLAARKGESVILDGTGVAAADMINISSKSYITVDGLTLKNNTAGSTPVGIRIEGMGSDITIRNCTITAILKPSGNAHGIGVWGTSGTTPYSRVTLENNEIYGCKLGQSESMVLNGNVTNFRVTGNRIHDNDNIAIDFIGYEGTAPQNDQARDGICSGNTVYNISSATNPTYDNRCADGIYVDGGKNIIIEGNNVDNCDIGIEIASEHGGKSTSQITVRNNFISRSYQANILCGGYAANRGAATDIIIVNNTTWQGNDAEVALQYNCNRVFIANNILGAKSGKVYIDNWGSNNTNVTVRKNCYFGASTNSPGSFADNQALYVNPQLKTPPSNLHCASNSPCINSGNKYGNDTIGTVDIDGEARIAQTGIDIGADETGPATAIVNRAIIRSSTPYQKVNNLYGSAIFDLSGKKIITRHGNSCLVEKSSPMFNRSFIPLD